MTHCVVAGTGKRIVRVAAVYVLLRLTLSLQKAIVSLDPSLDPYAGRKPRSFSAFESFPVDLLSSPCLAGAKEGWISPFTTQF